MKIISKTFIYILLFVLTYFIYINPLLTLNTVGILNSTKNIHEFDVVVSHYKEDLSWLDNLTLSIQSPETVISDSI